MQVPQPQNTQKVGNMRSQSLSLSDSLRLLPVAHQALLSMGFSRQEYWCWLPFPTSRDFPNAGIEPALLHLLHRQADSLPLSHLGSPFCYLHPLSHRQKKPQTKNRTHTRVRAHAHTHTHTFSPTFFCSPWFQMRNPLVYIHMALKNFSCKENNQRKYVTLKRHRGPTTQLYYESDLVHNVATEMM